MGDSESKKKWDKENTKRYGVKMYRSKDADMIKTLDGLPNVTEFIKSAIREKIERDKTRT